jgi:hypothetical protein
MNSLSLCVYTMYVLYVHTQYLCMPPCMRGLHGAKDFIWQFRSGRCTIELRPSVSARVRPSCTDGDRYHLAPTPSFVSISFTPLAFSSDLLSPLSFLRTLPLFSSSLRTSHSFGPRSGLSFWSPNRPPPRVSTTLHPPLECLRDNDVDEDPRE